MNFFISIKDVGKREQHDDGGDNRHYVNRQYWSNSTVSDDFILLRLNIIDAEMQRLLIKSDIKAAISEAFFVMVVKGLINS